MENQTIQNSASIIVLVQNEKGIDTIQVSIPFDNLGDIVISYFFARVPTFSQLGSGVNVVAMYMLFLSVCLICPVEVFLAI